MKKIITLIIAITISFTAKCQVPNVLVLTNKVSLVHRIDTIYTNYAIVVDKKTKAMTMILNPVVCRSYWEKKSDFMILETPIYSYYIPNDTRLIWAINDHGSLIITF